MTRTLTPRAALVVLGAMMLVSVAARTYLGRKIAAPQLLCDEFIYAGIAKSLALHGHYLLRHEPNAASLVYPALIAPAWWANSMETAYGLAKAINAGVMTLTALPFYFWARRLSSPLYALGATAVLLMLPAFNYTAMLMTENAFLPAFVAATYAIARSLERPSVPSQLLVVAAVLIALGVRSQAAALVLVLPTGVVLNVLLDRASGVKSVPSRLARGFREQWVALGAFACLGLAYLWLSRSSGRGFGYQDVIGADYSFVDGARTALYNLAGLTLEIGVWPVSAFILVVGLAIRASPRPSPSERAFVAVGTATVFWLLIEIGFFTSRFASHFPVERYSFYLDSILLLALVSWLHMGLPRPRALTAAAAIIPAALVLWFPLARFIHDSPLYSSFSLFYFFNLVGRFGGGVERVELLASLGAVLAALSFAFIPRRLALVAIPTVMALFFIGVSRPAFGSLRQYGFFARYETGLGADSSWIEREVGRDQPVTFLYSESGSDKWGATRILMQAEFWNRNVQSVTNTGESELCPLPERSARIDSANGLIRPVTKGGAITTSTVVTNQTVKLAGRPLFSRPPLVAYRIPGRLQLGGAYEGLYADGWTGSDAAYSAYVAPPRGSVLSVGVSRVPWSGTDVPAHVLVRVGTLASGSGGRPRLGRVTARRTWVIHAGSSKVFTFPAPKRPYRVELHVDPTFVPADFGAADPRPLGAVFVVSAAPRAPS